jgi:hypothetical protein
VCILPGKPEAYQEHRGAKDALKVANDGDGATFTSDHRLAAKSRGKRTTGRIE